MPEDIDPEVLAEIEIHLGRQRGYASFHQWHDRQIMERGIVSDLLQAVPDEFDPNALVRSLQRDPPDCLLESPGSRIGVEVTELVDQAFLESVARAKRAGVVNHDWAVWDRERFLVQIGARVRAKAHPPAVFGGPFDEYVLLVHTAEPGLEVTRVHGWLEQAVPIPAGILSRAYLLFDYRPGEGRQALRLPIAGSTNDAAQR